MGDFFCSFVCDLAIGGCEIVDDSIADMLYTTSFPLLFPVVSSTTHHVKLLPVVFAVHVTVNEPVVSVLILAIAFSTPSAGFLIKVTVLFGVKPLPMFVKVVPT